MISPTVWDFAPETAIRFVEHVLKVPAGTFHPANGLLIVRDNMPIAGVCFHNFRELEHGRTVEGSIGSIGPKWATKQVLRAVFDYAFNYLGCARFQAVTRADAADTRKFLLRLGFQEEGQMRQYWDAKTDAVLYAMLKRDCRWLGVEEHGEISTKAA